MRGGVWRARLHHHPSRLRESFRESAFDSQFTVRRALENLEAARGWESSNVLSRAGGYPFEVFEDFGRIGGRAPAFP